MNEISIFFKERNRIRLFRLQNVYLWPILSSPTMMIRDVTTGESVNVTVWRRYKDG